MKERNKRIVQAVLTVLAAGMIGFIFWNSSQTGNLSQARSTGILTFLQGILKLPVSEFFVRKSAHFLEFCVLGLLVGGTVRAYTRAWMARVMIPLFLGLLVPICDEFFQTFIDGRSGEVRDVLIDFAGAVTGLGAALLVTVLVDRHRRKKQELVLWR